MTEKKRSQAGQAEVETAIVLPLVTFLLLGLIQLGLLHQARIIAEYAAYRAVRTGALRVYPGRDAWIEGMERAALAAALPILSCSQGFAGGPEILPQTNSAGGWIKKWMRPGFGGTWPVNRMIDVGGLIEYADVKVCGPLRGDVQEHIYSVEGIKYVPFDIPLGVGSVIKTKLRIQLTLNVRMIIPFADWVIYRMWRGWTIADDLHLGEGEGWSFDLDLPAYDAAARLAKVFIIPVRVHYAMKLHSDVPLDHFPENNHCL